MTTPEQREAILDGLEKLAKFLREHPELPVSRHWVLQVHTGAETGTGNDDDEGGIAAVNAAAEAMGVEPTGTAHYRATREFGAVSYEVLHIASDTMRAHHAQQSYVQNIQVDEGR